MPNLFRTRGTFTNKGAILITLHLDSTKVTDNTQSDTDSSEAHTLC